MDSGHGKNKGTLSCWLSIKGNPYRKRKGKRKKGTTGQQSNWSFNAYPSREFGSRSNRRIADLELNIAAEQIASISAILGREGGIGNSLQMLLQNN